MSNAYQQAGVDIHAGYEAVERISSHVKRSTRWIRWVWSHF